MNVRCPECSTVYRVDPAKVPAGGVRARCAECSGVIPVSPAVGTGVASGQATAAPPRPSTAPVAGPRVSAPRPAPSGGAPPLRMTRPVSGPAVSVPPTPPTPPKAAPTPTRPVIVRPDAEELARARQAAQARPSAPVFRPTEGPPLRSAPVPPAPPPEAPAVRPVEAAPEPPAAPAEPAVVETPAEATPPQPEVAYEPPAPADLAPPEATAPPVEEPAVPTELEVPPEPPPAPPEAPAMSAPPAVEEVAQEPPPAPPEVQATPEPPVAAPEAPAVAPAALTEPPRAPINPFLSRDPRQKARRLARALVSDMIVYQPEKRQQSLAGGTLKEDFDEEIKKSWQEYVDQVGEEMANSTPFFTEALNEILAGGQQLF